MIFPISEFPVVHQGWMTGPVLIVRWSAKFKWMKHNSTLSILWESVVTETLKICTKTGQYFNVFFLLHSHWCGDEWPVIVKAESLFWNLYDFLPGFIKVELSSGWLLHVFLISHVKTSQQTFDRFPLWIVWSVGRVYPAHCRLLLLLTSLLKYGKNQIQSCLMEQNL